MPETKPDLNSQHDDVASLCSVAKIDPSGYRRFGGAMNLPAEPPDPSADSAPAPDKFTDKAEAVTGIPNQGDARQRSPRTGFLPEPGRPQFPNVVRLQARSSSSHPYRLAPPAASVEPRTAEDVPLAPPRTRLAIKRIAEHSRAQSPSPWRHRKCRNLIPIYSIAGGVGTTTVLASLARVLSRLGDQVLILDGARQPFINLFFGGGLSCEGLSTYLPNRNSGEGAIHILNSGDEMAASDLSLASEEATEDGLWPGLCKFCDQVDHVLVDVCPGLPDHSHPFLLSEGFCVAVVTPDIRSLLAINQFLSWLTAQEQALGHHLEPYFLLNCVDRRVPFHLEMEEQLRRDLGSRLLPFHIPRSDDIPEATAEGMTIVDFAAGSPVVESFTRLANWVRDLSTRSAVQGA